MKVENNGKELYHIQNLNMGSETPFDAFVWADHYPNRADLKTVFLEEFGDCSYSDLLEEFLTSSDIYKVWAEEV